MELSTRTRLRIDDNSAAAALPFTARYSLKLSTWMWRRTLVKPDGRKASNIILEGAQYSNVPQKWLMRDLAWWFKVLTRVNFGVAGFR